MEKVIIGGEERDVRLLTEVCDGIFKEFYQAYAKNKNNPRTNKAIAEIKQLYDEQRRELLQAYEGGVLTKEDFDLRALKMQTAEFDTLDKMKVNIPKKYFYDAIWKVLVKKYFWPFRKPFRSKRHMVKNMELHEGIQVITFIGQKILGFKTEDETASSKKKDFGNSTG